VQARQCETGMATALVSAGGRGRVSGWTELGQEGQLGQKAG
jgi:hypothetical protein